MKFSPPIYILCILLTVLYNAILIFTNSKGEGFGLHNCVPVPLCKFNLSRIDCEGTKSSKTHVDLGESHTQGTHCVLSRDLSLIEFKGVRQASSALSRIMGNAFAVTLDS